MGGSFKKGFTTFILCCSIAAMLGACTTQRANPAPERQNRLQQGQNTQLQGIENQNAFDLTPQTGQTRNPLIMNDQNNNKRNALNTTPGTAQRQNKMLNNNDALINNATLDNNGIIDNNANDNANNNGNNNQPGLFGQMNADTAKSERIKAQLEKMSGVDDVSVIVLGNTALIGCDINNNNAKNISTGNTDDLRNKIIQQVKGLDNSITNCIVTDKPEILEKINALGNDITNGKPGNEITNEFNRIIRSIKQ